MKKNYTIATRKSPLAMQQACFIRDALLQHYPDLSIALLPMETTGDQLQGQLLNAVGGKGLFVKELEKALLDKRADFAVHSMKDMPAEQPEGLTNVVVGEREDPRDVLISIQYTSFSDLPEKAKMGTASLRRQCQVYRLNPTLDVHMLRGNVNTRLNRLMQGDFDAIILAAAGLKRLNLTQYITHYFTTEQLLPAAGQGALGVEYRTDDIALRELLSVLIDPLTQACVVAERAMTAQLNGNCRAPVAAFCEMLNGQLRLRGLVGSADGKTIITCDEMGEQANPEALGLRAAELLRQQGAEKLLTLVSASHG